VRYCGTETVLGIVAALAAQIRMLVTAIWLLVKRVEEAKTAAKSKCFCSTAAKRNLNWKGPDKRSGLNRSLQHWLSFITNPTDRDPSPGRAGQSALWWGLPPPWAAAGALLRIAEFSKKTSVT
jgi:hypothetical protein